MKNLYKKIKENLSMYNICSMKNEKSYKSVACYDQKNCKSIAFESSNIIC